MQQLEQLAKRLDELQSQPATPLTKMVLLKAASSTLRYGATRVEKVIHGLPEAELVEQRTVYRLIAADCARRLGLGDDAYAAVVTLCEPDDSVLVAELGRAVRPEALVRVTEAVAGMTVRYVRESEGGRIMVRRRIDLFHPPVPGSSDVPVTTMQDLLPWVDVSPDVAELLRYGDRPDVDFTLFPR